MGRRIHLLVLLWLHLCTTEVNSQSCPPQSGAYMIHKGSCVANNTYFRAIDLNGEGNGLHCLVANANAQPEWFFPNGSHMDCGIATDRFSCIMTSNSSILMYSKSTVVKDENTLGWAGVYSCCLFGKCNSRSSNRATARIFNTKYVTNFSVSLPKNVALFPQKYTVHCVVENFDSLGNIPFIAYQMEGVDITKDLQLGINGDTSCEKLSGVTCIHKHNPAFVSVAETPRIDSQLNVTWNASTVITERNYFPFDDTMNGDHDIRCQSRATNHNASAYITIRAPNFTPSTSSLCLNSATSVTIKWMLPSFPPDADGYIIYYKTDNGSDMHVKVDGGNVSQYTLQELLSNTKYNIKLRAYQDILGPASEFVNVIITNTAPGPVSDVAVYPDSSSSITVQWSPPSTNICTINYFIMYTATCPGTSETQTGSANVSANHTFYKFQFLKGNTQYTFSIIVKSLLGDSNITTINGVTKLSAPSAPPQNVVITTSESTVIIEWEQVVCFSRNGAITGYIISVSGGGTSENKTSNATYMYIEINGLMHFTTYNISVAAINKIGVGPFSDAKTVTIEGSTQSPSSSFGVVVGGVVALVIMIILVLVVTVPIVILVLRKNSWKNYSVKDGTSQFRSPTCTYTAETEKVSLPMETQYAGEGPIPSVNESPADDEITHTYAEPPEEYIYAFIPANARSVIFDHQIPTTLPILLSRLGSHVAKCHTNENEAFLQQFTELYSGEDKSSAVAFASDKKPFNRFKNIGPYDDNMVVLKPLDHSGCDREYINASFVDGFSIANKFIASQGPFKKTVTDFWRMVWQEHPQCIVMVTNLTEGGKSKCEQYWPSTLFDEHKFGPFTVTLVDEQVLPDFVIRKMRIWMVEDSTHFHPITQYHFVSWPDHGVPSSPTPLLTLHKRVMNGWNPEGGPILVHCSAGVGRTGTFIALDLALEQADRKGEVDIAGITNRLRHQRMKMVQTEDQYAFLHDVVLEALLCGNTEVSSTTFAKHLDMLKMPNSRNGKSELETQFELLAHVTPDPITVVCKTANECMEKNRAKTYLPMDRWRVILYGEHPGYIHASFIKGYKTKKAFIIAQSPKKNTVRDFWKMISENRVSAVVMLSPQYESNEEVCYQYWGSAPDSSEKFGEYYIESKTLMEKEQLITREISAHKEEKEKAAFHLTQFQILDWPDDGQVRDTRTILEVIEEVIRAQQRGGGGPVVVHCSDTVSRSGVYCAVTNALEQCKAEGVVDVFQAVKAIRMQKPGAVISVEQYESVFELVKSYLSMFETYANFR